MKQKSLLKTIILLCALVAGNSAWADETDIIDNAATSSNLGNTATSNWGSNFSITGASGAVYYIHSMGTKSTQNALQWNSNGFLYMTGTCSDHVLKSVTITTTANKNIGLYAQNSAYTDAPSGTALATLAATSSGATYTFTSDYTYLALKGTASSTSITNITIEWKSTSGGDTPTTYTVTYSANGGTGTMTDSNSPYKEDDEVTLLANTFTAPAGKTWDSWSVKDASDNTISVTEGKFTMPASDVTVTAQWADLPSHTAHFSVNGTIDNNNDCTVAEGVAITFPSDPAAISGKSFVGWVTEAITGTTNTAPSIVTSATMGSSDITYYAVFADVNGSSSGAYTLDYELETGLSSSTSWSYGNAITYTATDGSSWTVKAYKNAGMQINTDKNCSIKVPDCPGNITSISITGSTYKAVGFSASDYTGSETITYLAEGTDDISQTLDLSKKMFQADILFLKVETHL
ncbi:MAG: InlB B-repeat-containing protein [Prevotella sp.]|nr:InlB B-repeat-containing protein [Prevotella sp.]